MDIRPFYITDKDFLTGAGVGETLSDPSLANLMYGTLDGMRLPSPTDIPQLVFELVSKIFDNKYSDILFCPTIQRWISCLTNAISLLSRYKSQVIVDIPWIAWDGTVSDTENRYGYARDLLKSIFDHGISRVSIFSTDSKVLYDYEYEFCNYIARKLYQFLDDAYSKVDCNQFCDEDDLEGISNTLGVKFINWENLREGAGALKQEKVKLEQIIQYEILQIIFDELSDRHMKLDCISDIEEKVFSTSSSYIPVDLSHKGYNSDSFNNIFINYRKKYAGKAIPREDIPFVKEPTNVDVIPTEINVVDGDKVAMDFDIGSIINKISPKYPGKKVNIPKLSSWIAIEFIPGIKNKWDWFGLRYLLTHYSLLNDSGLNYENFKRVISEAYNKLGVIEMPVKLSKADPMSRCDIICNNRLVDNAKEMWLEKYNRLTSGMEKNEFSKSGCYASFDTIKKLLAKFNIGDFLL